MSDETASQIEHLIEITKQDFELKAALLEDNVEGDILVAELLQDIKLDVSDIKDGLFLFFEEEQDRFAIQQGLSKEQYFRTLEALREGAGAGGQQASAGTGFSQQGQGDGDTRGAGAIAGYFAGGAAAGGAGKLASLLFRRLPQLALIAGAISGVIDFLAERPKLQEALSKEGLEGRDLSTEVNTQALGEVASDLANNIIEPLVVPIATAFGKEFGLNSTELEQLRKSIDELSTVFKDTTIKIVDTFSSLFGYQSSRASLREDTEELGELQLQIDEAKVEAADAGLMTSEGQLTDKATQGLTRLEELSAEREELNRTFTRSPVELRRRKKIIADISSEERSLEQQLEPITRQRQLEGEKQQLESRSILSQAGYDAGDIDNELLTEYQEIPAAEKQEFFDKRITPKLNEAKEAGAIDYDYSQGIQNYISNVVSGAIVPLESGAIAIPLENVDMEALESLSADQLLAILTNDDILGAVLQAGQMPTGDREIVEMFYRMKALGADDPRVQGSVPQLDLGGTVEPGQAAIVGEKGPELVLGPAEVVGREDTSRIFDLLEPSPAVSAIVPVGDMSRNVAATSSAPIVIASTQGGSTVNNMVNNSTTVMGGGASARTADVSHRRLADRMSGVV